MAGKRWCSAPNCSNFRGKIANLSFFKFPKDVERCCIWIKNSGRDDLLKRNIAALYDSGLCLCAEHFGPDMFMNVELRNKLVSNAVPTVFEAAGNRTMILLPLKSSRSIKRKSTSPGPSPSTTRHHPGDARACNGPSSSPQPPPPPPIQATDQPAPNSRDPGHGPQFCSMEDGPYRPRSFELPGDGFPKRRLGQSSRSFQESWYLLYPWLEYSVVKDAAFCFYCRLFVTQIPYRLERAFVYEGYRYWKNASLDMRLHCNSKVHTESKAAYDLYRRTRRLTDTTPTTVSASTLSSTSHRSVAKVIDTVLFMGRQGLLLKNRRQRHSLANGGGETRQSCEEHFLEYLKWHARDDHELFPWLLRVQSAARHNQDDELDLDGLIALCVEEVQRGIVGDVNESGDGYFALLLDQPCEGASGNSSSSNNNEDIDEDDEDDDETDSGVVSIGVRYVNRQLRVHERFLGFYSARLLHSTSGVPGERLWRLLDALGLRRGRLRALSFGVLAPVSARLAAVEVAMMTSRPQRLTEESWVAPLAVASHARSLDLAVQRLCQSIRPVRDTLQTVSRLYELFAWSTVGRATCSQLCLFTEEEETWMGGAGGGGEDGDGLRASQSAVGAASSTTFLCAVRDDIDLVVRGLRSIAAGDSHLGAEAADLLVSVETFHFVYYLHVMCKVLNMVDDLVCFLEDPDDFTVHRLSKLARAVVGTVRRAKTRSYFADTLEEVLRETDKLGVEPPPFLLAASSSPPAQPPPRKTDESNAGEVDPWRRPLEPSAAEIEYRQHLIEICDVVECELATQFGVGRSNSGGSGSAGGTTTTTSGVATTSSRLVLESLDALVVDLRTSSSSSSAKRRHHLETVSEHFAADLLTADRLTAELDMFAATLDVDPDWSGADLSKVPDMVCHFDEQGYAAVFPSIHRLLMLYLLMPTVPPRPDRDLSVLKRLQRHLEATSADPRRRPDELAAVLAVEREEVLKLSQPDLLDGLAKKYVGRRVRNGNGSSMDAVTADGFGDNDDDSEDRVSKQARVD